MTSNDLIYKTDPGTAKRNINEAIAIYLKLAKKYQYSDPMVPFYLSVKAENPEGFYASCKMLILSSADSVSEIIRKYGNTYGKNDLSAVNREPLATAVKKIRKEEASLIQQARLRLDWKWNVELAAIFKSNIDFREYPDEYFKDSMSRREAMVYIDSTHFVQFCDFVKKNGFPHVSTVGLRAGLVAAPLRHFSALTCFPDAKRADYFIEKWKFLMPYIYDDAKNDELGYSFYNLLHGWIISFLKRNNRTADIEYFKKFELQD